MENRKGNKRRRKLDKMKGNKGEKRKQLEINQLCVISKSKYYLVS